MPNNSEIDILLVGNGGSSFEILKSILRGYPRLSSLRWCDNCVDGIEEINRLRPGLVLLSSNLYFEEVITCVKAIRQQRPRQVSLVLLDDHHEYQRLLEFGVSEILMDGYSVQELFDRIDYLQVSNALRNISQSDIEIGQTA
jgi:two-component SAPR family response regulator